MNCQTRTLLTLLFLFGFFYLKAQITDCVGAEVLCTDGVISFNPSGSGANDFSNPANDNGCLAGNEHQSAWYYFEFQADMPPNSQIEFTIDPNGGSGEDYDFAIYGPNVECDALGSPIACSFAASSCAFCPTTGLGNGATDTSEGAGGDGYVAPLTVQPGQGFFLLVDNWLGSSNGFDLSWGGSGAPFLNCNANPVCELMVSTGPQIDICAGDPATFLTGSASGIVGVAQYTWTELGGNNLFIDNPNSPSTSLTIPPGFIGNLMFQLTVTDNACSESATVNVNVSSAPTPVIQGDMSLCVGENTILDAGPGYNSYLWSTGSNLPQIGVFNGGTYSVTVTNAGGCQGVASFTVNEFPVPTPVIQGDPTVCLGTTTLLDAGPGYFTYNWSNGAITQTIDVGIPGLYSVTVTSANNCEGIAFIDVTSTSGIEPNIPPALGLCQNSSTVIDAGPGYMSYNWSNGSTSQTTVATQPGNYTVTVIDNTGCVAIGFTTLFVIPDPQPQITGDLQVCTSESTVLEVASGFNSYLWSDGSTGTTLTAPGPGVYSVTVTNLDGCEGTDQVTITTLDPPQPIINGDLSICPGSSTTLSAPAGFNSYQWSNNSTNPVIDVSAAGIYTLTVIDANGCEGSTSVEVLENTPPQVTIQGTTTICAGGSTVLDAGPGFSSYLWSNGSTSQILATSVPGTYTVTIQDNEGCEGQDAVTITSLADFEPTISGDLTFCEGTSTTLIAEGGFNSYVWSNGSTSQQIEVTNPGTFLLEVTNGNGCTSSTTVSVSTVPNPSPIIVGESAFCTGTSTTLSAPAGFNSYQWSDGTTGVDLPVSAAGAYLLTVTDSEGCIGTSSITVTEIPLPVPVIAGDLEFCEDRNINVTPDTPYPFYTWSDGSTAPSFETNIPGTYSVTVTDDNGCEGETTFEAIQLANPSPDIIGILEFCEGTFTTLSAPDGFSEYLWSEGSTEVGIEVTSAGSYGVTVLDANGCAGEAMVEVSTMALPTPIVSGVLNFCEGESVTLSVDDPYSTYLWSNGTFGSETTISTPGQYTVSVTVEPGCEGETTVEVIENSSPTVDITGESSFCSGNSVTLEADAGFQSYIWSDNSMDATIDIDVAGTYTVSVTDDNGCIGINQFSVTEFAEPTPVIAGLTEFCQGASTELSLSTSYNAVIWSLDGQQISFDSILTASVAGTYSAEVISFNGCSAETSVVLSELVAPNPEISGDLSFCEDESAMLSITDVYANYLWSNGGTETSIEVASPGTYGLTVTDNNGCEGESSVDITQNTVPVINITGELDFCAGLSTTIFAPPGFSSYIWSNGSTNESLVVSESADYSVTVVDENGCEGTDDILIIEDPLPEPEIAGVTEICPSDSAMLGIELLPEYNIINWLEDNNSIALGDSAMILDGGIYEVIVTDINGCEGRDTLVVTDLLAPEPTITGDVDICEGETSLFTVNENFPEYLWQDGTTEASIVIEEAGDYSVTVTDANGCKSATSLALVEFPLPEVSITGDLEFCTATTTTLEATPGYVEYAWSNNSMENTLTISMPGDYTVEVTDVNGCRSTASVIVEENPLPNPEILGQASFCPGGSSDLSLNDSFQTIEWTGAGSFQSTAPTITVTEAGTYTAAVTDANGCSALAEIEIAIFEELLPEISGVSSICAGAPTTLSSEDNYALYTWSTGSTASSITVDQAGIYTLFVEDANGCTGETSIEIVENELPQPVITGPNAFCAGSSLDIAVATTFESYNWSTTASTAGISVGTAGTYVVTVTDANGCEGTAATLIEEIALPEPNIAGLLSFCPEGNTTLSAVGNFESYSWSTGETGTTVQIDQPGMYNLLVSDANGCEGTVGVELTNFETQIPTFSGALDFCPETSTNLSVVENFESYNWTTNSIQPEIEIETPGVYGLTVTDANGCITENTVELNFFQVAAPNITGADAFCTGEQITLSAEPGFESYNWSDQTQGQELIVTAEGSYTVEATDMNGCVTSADFFVEENPLPDLVIGGSTSFCTGSFTTLNAGGTYSTYEWSDGTTMPTLVVTTPGNYSLNVIDENGCTAQTAVDVIEAAELSPVITGPLAFCPGASTTIDAGTGFASYQWSNGTSGQVLEVAAPGTYSVLVMDASGCMGEDEVEVLEFVPPSPVIDGLTAFCTGESIELSTLNTYDSYSWTNGANTQTIEVSTPATYQVEVIDDNGCAGIAAIDVEELDVPVVSIEGQDFYCTGSSTTLSVNSNQTIENFEWSEGSTSATIDVANAGIYTVLVQNAGGCETTAEIQISEIENPIADAGIGGLLTCAIESVVLGGTNTSQGNDFDYEWTGPGITAFNANVAFPEVTESGLYNLIVTDLVYGCISEAASILVVNSADIPTVSVEANAILNCETATVTIDGSASANFPSIVYQWFDAQGNPIPGAVLPTLEISTPQIYELQVLDTLTGCSATANIEIEVDENFPTAEAGEPALLNCDIAEATLDATASASGANIVYNWTTMNGTISTGANTLSPTVIAPGTYVLQVLDQSNGCSSQDVVLVTQDIEAPIADAGLDQEIDCLRPEALLDGSNSSTGTAISYEWTSGATVLGTSLELEVSNEGTYTLVVTNSENGCTSTDFVLVESNGSIPSDIDFMLVDPACFDDANGSININSIEGGTPPYLYSFNGQEFSATSFYPNLEAGHYSFVVQDAIGCEYSTQVFLEPGNDLHLDLGEDISIRIGETAILQALTNNLENPISWTTTDTLDCMDCAEQEVQPFETTTYLASIVDENGCKASDQITVFVDNPQEVYIPNAFSPNNDGINDIFMIFAGDDVKVVRSFLVFNRWGETVFDFYNIPPNDPAFGWDGKYRGGEHNAAVFAYMAEIEFVNGDVVIFKGDVSLIK